MIETLILSFLSGLIGGMISYLISKNIGRKHVKEIQVNAKTKVSISNFNHSHVIHIQDDKKDLMIDVKKSGINYFRYAEQ